MESEKILRDTVGRRRRNAKRQPTTPLTLSTRDIELLSFIHRFGGMLTTPIIARYAKVAGIYRNPYSVEKRLRDLYHETGYIDRPIEQRQIEYPERFPLVHRISEAGERYLKDKGLFLDNAPKPWGTYRHNMMLSCLYASYYISALEHGFGFTPQHELPHISIVVDGQKVTPDAVFKLSVSGKEILVFLEADRATEAGHSTDDKRKTWGRSVEQYQKVIGHKLYKQHYGVSPNCGAQVHVVTISHSMKDKILRQVARVYPDGCSYFFLNVSDAFGDITHPPKYMDMLTTRWERWKHLPFLYVDNHGDSE